MVLIKKINSMRKFKVVMFELSIMAFMFMIMATLLSKLYLFEWFVHNYWLYLMIAITSVILVLLNKKLISVFVSIGSIVGIFIGQLLGDLLRSMAMRKITTFTVAEKVQHLSEHNGFSIFVIIVILFIIVGSVLQYKVNDVKQK